MGYILAVVRPASHGAGETLLSRCQHPESPYWTKAEQGWRKKAAKLNVESSHGKYREAIVLPSFFIDKTVLAFNLVSANQISLLYGALIILDIVFQKLIDIGDLKFHNLLIKSIC